MQQLSLLTVLLAGCLRIGLAQNGYNYDRPENSGRPGGFQGSTGPQTAFPPTSNNPTFSQSSFASNQVSGGGYNYPPQMDELPSGSSGTTGYPSQRPSGNGYSPQGGTSAGQPYPSAQTPSTGGSYPGTQGPTAGGSYPSSSQGQRPTGPATAPQRPSSIGSQPAYGGSQQRPTGNGYGPNTQGNQGGNNNGGVIQKDENEEGDYSAIPGEPETDYPIYSEIPETSFDCSQQEFPGYYADVDTRCQVFHICAMNRTFDFLCPNGTIFSQEHLVCVWWNQFDCSSAPGLYANNANIYDYSQNGEQNNNGQGQGQNQGGVANDFVGGGASNSPYPNAGRPQGPTNSGFGGGSTGPSGSYPNGPSNYQPSAPAGSGNYPGATGGSGYPGTGQTTGPAGFKPSGPSQYPSTQGPYPSGGSAAPPSNVPSSSYVPPQGFPPQADSPYPTAGSPQSPNREYLPPRRG
ncbi:CLUMA_CG012076, isoform A [Clunio marinus]|uniref:CLUMA_CG012076, isoform A n=1 Tax=Clunio marinus TaxID=568069 RepID=A0A1J1IKI8_9DIPT|nr:CLUMA_CG012076, isoform A [Clunio marinus]